jgi:hypothetical protein
VCSGCDTARVALKMRANTVTKRGMVPLCGKCVP